VPARLHRADIISDVFGGAKRPSRKRAGALRSEGRGVLVYLRDGAAGVPANWCGRARITPRRTAGGNGST
jgi:3,4-dihydroxy 2-butanone 4-phosphate synthase / GTP cyclohydrolase II